MKKRRILYALFICIILVGLAYLALPKPKLLENFGFSSAIYDRSGRLLRLTLSSDDKYRLFTGFGDIPEEFVQALLLYEDRHFYYHPGVDPLAVGRAAANMLSSGRKQGASTITMQLARLIHNIDSSTISGKLRQMFRAIQLERHYSKREILEGYFNLAPYGGNIEGIGAASLAYFGRPADKLSLPEILALTVIPQNPGSRGPSSPAGRRGMMEAQQRFSRAWKERYAEHPENTYLGMPLAVASVRELPLLAPHFANQVLETHRGTVHTTLDLGLQQQLERTVQSYVKRNASKGIHNASVLLVDHRTMHVLAQIGSADFFNGVIQGQVDGTRAQRSPGSAMKPFIYALALEKGVIHPLTMLKDLPRNFHFYTPENFDSQWSGILSATSALVYSRNIPAVDLLQKIRQESMYGLLADGGVRNLRGKDFYGLALALGGFEISLQEMARMYAMLANYGRLRDLVYVPGQEERSERLLSPEAAYLTLDMLGYNAPVDRKQFKIKTLSSAYPVYWKTGTSYAYKDAVSIGVFGPYVLAVWIGNFDGTPNHSFVGRSMAAPLFFEIVRSLEKTPDFGHRLSAAGLDLAKVDICRTTGDIADTLCPSSVKSWFIPGVSPIKLSNVHRRIPVDVKTGLRACRHTPPATELKVFEFWPSDVRSAFRMAGVYRKPPPDFADECKNMALTVRGHNPEIMLPVPGLVHIVRSHKLQEEKIVLKASTDSDADTVYWFMDEALLGTSKPDEALEIPAKIGTWDIKAVDSLGRSSSQKLTVRLVD